MSVDTKGQILLMIDDDNLRFAAMKIFLNLLAEMSGLTLRILEPGSPLTETQIYPYTRLVLLCIGGRSPAALDVREQVGCVQASAPNASLILVADSEQRSDILAAFQSGARGYIPTQTDPAIALHAIRFVLSGGTYIPPSVLEHLAHAAEGNRNGEAITDLGAYRPAEGLRLPAASDQKSQSHTKVRGHLTMLTVRQREVLEHLCQGASNKMIARALGMTEATVKVHVRQIMHKFGARNRTQVVLATVDGDLDNKTQAPAPCPKKEDRAMCSKSKAMQPLQTIAHLVRIEDRVN